MEKSRFFDKIKRKNENEEIVKNYKLSKLKRKYGEIITVVIDEEDEDNNNVPICPICLEKCKEQCNSNKCLHNFCFDCILEWGKVKPICPLCKVEFTFVSNKLGTIYKEFTNQIQEEEEELEEEEVQDDYNNNENIISLIEDNRRNRSYGYELDGFVVGDDFVEYDS